MSFVAVVVMLDRFDKKARKETGTAVKVPT